MTVYRPRVHSPAPYAGPHVLSTTVLPSTKSRVTYVYTIRVAIDSPASPPPTQLVIEGLPS